MTATKTAMLNHQQKIKNALTYYSALKTIHITDILTLKHQHISLIVKISLLSLISITRILKL